MGKFINSLSLIGIVVTGSCFAGVCEVVSGSLSLGNGRGPSIVFISDKHPNTIYAASPDSEDISSIPVELKTKLMAQININGNFCIEYTKQFVTFYASNEPIQVIKVHYAR